MLTPFLRVHIMGEDKGEFLVMGPARPFLGRCAGAMINGPYMAVPPPLVRNQLSSKGNLKRPRHKGPDVIVEGVERGQGSWMLDSGCWLLVTGYWMLAPVESCFAGSL